MAKRPTSGKAKGNAKAIKPAGSSRNPFKPPPAGKDASAARSGRTVSQRGKRMAPEARRQAILQAALAVFAEHGFEAARLEDVAVRAGVAKGTLYLYFTHKEALFEALIRDAATPVIEQLERLAANADTPPMLALERIFATFREQVLGSDRKLVLRLIIAEGARFPALAAFYHREVVSRGLAAMRRLAERASGDGSFATVGPAHYPQLLIAPLLVAVIWDGLFSSIEPLDVRGMIAAHLDVLAGKPPGGAA